MNFTISNETRQQQPNANFGFTKLQEPSRTAPNSVGLNVHNNVINSAGATTNDVVNNIKKEDNAVTVSFNNLLIPKTAPVSNRFGVQPLAEEADRSMLPKPKSPEDLKAISERLSNDQQKSNNKKVNNWFTRLFDQRGQDYISSGKLSVDEVSKNAERIIEEMVAGRIDYDKYAQYIIEPTIIETLINYCANKLAISKSLQFSLGYTYNDYISRNDLMGDPARYNRLCMIDDALSRNMAQSISIVNTDISYYSIIHDKLVYVNSTKNVSALYSLTNELNNYMKQMKRRY